MNANDLPPVLPPRSTPRSSNPPDPGRSTSPSPVASSSSSSQSQPQQQQQRNVNGQTTTSSSSSSSSNNSQQQQQQQHQQENHRDSPAYAPFLSHLPPPADSWIEVETRATEYRLNVRLPGFKRDGITLATKRRRILHVVADSWENGGGHFERRISFGYDADLVQVRAEFDGEMLRVVVPRRATATGMGGMEMSRMV
ncbi:hypothetical protein K435DRAFT_668920 [Dendrothele bispora CBS 962.96]|uniref:SHSP domain-containing protein n=1 Tax=Dendrothele bispora (strain CBS 962.96) TaxID=1314807 RepID=A0A4S8LY96_DENBC|nr:hypothetical protein K435DRAFT_668920 [Dendrothele bispora CBS 962.96]